MTQVCGDPTCESKGCATESFRTWERRELAETRRFIADVLDKKGEIKVLPYQVIEQEDID